MRAASREPRRHPEIREGQREIYQREGWATHGRSLGQEQTGEGSGKSSFCCEIRVLAARLLCIENELLFLMPVFNLGFGTRVGWHNEMGIGDSIWRNKITWLLLRYLVDIELCVSWSLVLAQLLNNSGHGSTHVLSRADDVYLTEFLWEMIRSKQSMTIIFLSYDCVIFWKDNCQDRKIRGRSRS